MVDANEEGVLGVNVGEVNVNASVKDDANDVKVDVSVNDLDVVVEGAAVVENALDPKEDLDLVGFLNQRIPKPAKVDYLHGKIFESGQYMHYQCIGVGRVIQRYPFGLE